MRIDKIYILSLNPTQETINKILSKLELIKLKQNIYELTVTGKEI